MNSWIGVDLDGTLAKRPPDWEGLEDLRIGEPIAVMVNRVIAWLDKGLEVRIVTARVARGFDPHGKHWLAVRRWSHDIFGQALDVTSEKDPYMVELWDDRAVAVEPDTGRMRSVVL